MQLLVSSVKRTAEIALLALLGQWIVDLLARGRRERNLFYPIPAMLAHTFARIACAQTPRVVLGRHVPLLAMSLLAFGWLIATLTILVGLITPTPSAQMQQLVEHVRYPSLKMA